ncbi:hypothetical protein A6J80_05615 [Paracoccus yeei]|uniref:DUF6950 domain-containing protein n=1 Tax=Paracoccus yeei TaxID=147645 RepID=A0A1V0GQ47_9RHOB|nr:hypothetical protein [Paracoccus yeei]ARC35930.1 hypothetical protein A6J80_05615 [Paracoccus yeei]
MGGLTRLPDWQARLHAWLGQIDGRPVRPGRHDCCLFGASAVEAQTGVDLAAPWRGRYTTMAGGRRVLRKAGYADHIALMAAHLPEVHPAYACEGDLAVVPTPEGPAVGVFQGSAIYVLTETGKLGLAPAEAGMTFFKVG